MRITAAGPRASTGSPASPSASEEKAWPKSRSSVSRGRPTRASLRLVCEEKGIDYDLKAVPPHSPEVIAIHPDGKIPVMRHSDLALFESKAIATYLDRSFPGAKLIPDDRRLAALTEQWISLVNAVMDGTLARSYVLCLPERRRRHARPQRGRSRGPGDARAAAAPRRGRR